MNVFSRKLAVAVLAAAALAPVGAHAAPALTNVQQLQTSVDATFNNTFTQSVSVSGDSAAGVAATDVTAGAGAANIGVYTLAPDITAPTLGASVIGGGTVPVSAAITDVTAQMTLSGTASVLTINPADLAGESASVSTTVFGVDNIRATQSVVESTTTTLF